MKKIIKSVDVDNNAHQKEGCAWQSSINFGQKTEL